MPQLTRRTFAATALAAAALPTFADTTLAPLHNKVSVLPTATPDQRRKKALLDWALEDIAASTAAGMADDAASLIADVTTALTGPPSKPSPRHKGLFPTIPTPHNNPWLDKTLLKVHTLIAANEKFPRGANPDAKKLGITYGYPYIQLGQEASLLAQALGNPDSPLYGDPTLIAPILRRFTASFEILTPGSKHLADFGVSPHISEMYCLLNSAFPDLILPSRRKLWQAALTLNSDAILKLHTQRFNEPGMPEVSLEEVFLQPTPGDCYPNAHSHYMNALLFAGLALNNDRYRKAAESAVALMATAFYPDGGTAYINLQNECFTYHGIMVEDLARLSQVTDNQHALDLVRSARWYYPLSITPQGVAEYSTAPCWKHYWNAVKGTSTASILASLLDCGYNAAVALNDSPSALWLAATFYKPVKPQPWWDSALFFDRNIQGPRGRFGQYSFCATARNTHQDRRGKLTYVGNLWVDTPSTALPRNRNWPINSGLDAAFAEVRLNTKPDSVNRWDTHACLARNESTASLAHPDFGTLTTRYQLATYGQDPIPVQGTQQWLITPHRLIGLITLESLIDQELFSMAVTLKTVSGRDNSGVRKEWVKHSPTHFEYGALTIRLWPLGNPATDLVTSGATLTSYTDTFSGTSNKCGILTLIDPAAAASSQQSKSTYAKAARHQAAVEIYPTAFPAAASFKLLEAPDGLLGLELVEANQTLQLLDNPTADSLGYAPTTKPTTLHRSGDKSRLPFLPPEPIPTHTLTPILAIPPGEHIVLRHA